MRTDRIAMPSGGVGGVRAAEAGSAEPARARNRTAERAGARTLRDGASAPTRGPIVVLRNISKRFGGNYALKGVDLELEKGEVHCLCGANGCGKSTLAKIISGTYRPDRGAVIVIGGREHPYLTPRESRDCGVQVIYQDLALFPNLSVYENIAFECNLGSLRPYRESRLRALAREALDAMKFDLDPDEPVENLTIARRQQVAICRALAADAKLVIMDEPTASLPRVEVNNLLAAVRYLKLRGITVVFVNHRLDEVLEVSDRVTVMVDGVKIGTFPASGMDKERLTGLIAGRRIDAGKRTKAAAAGETALEVRGLTRAGQFHDVSFALREGEVLGICGLLGSGRTELALSLFGMTRPDSGEMRIRGRAVRFRNQRDAIKAGVGYLSEDRLALGLIQPQSVKDNMVLTVMDRLKTFAGLISPAKRDRTVAEWVERLDIKAANVDDAVSVLSGGNQQKVALAKWILTDPKILILDSPTAGVDVGAKDGVHRLIRRLAERKIAVAVISDEVSEVYRNCDRILHFRRGTIAGEYSPDRVSERELAGMIENG
ncbi:MAG: sugar ABC transporter ATP-binding protein [Planctomycetota bacterium]|nr:sugar ABC transporter ATP-binding protein [Planctomycetota bacterium]